MPFHIPKNLFLLLMVVVDHERRTVVVDHERRTVVVVMIDEEQMVRFVEYCALKN